MGKISMSYLFSFSGCQTKCVIVFLFTQLMTSWTLRFIFDHPVKQWLTGRKRGKREIQKIKYLENEKSFLDEIKSIFHSFWRAIIWWKNKNMMKVADTSFNNKKYQNDISCALLLFRDIFKTQSIIKNGAFCVNSYLLKVVAIVTKSFIWNVWLGSPCNSESKFSIDLLYLFFNLKVFSM